MTPSDAEYIAGLIARRLGLPIAARLVAPDHLVLTPSEVHENDGFSVEVRTTWRAAEVSFIPGKYARPLIEKMGEAGEEARISFFALASTAGKNGKLSVKINGTEFVPQDSSPWPSTWQKFELALKKLGIVFEELTPTEIKQQIGTLVAPFFGMCVALIGIVDFDADASASEGNSEEELSRRYERKPVNREICLSVRGRRCYCCNVDFGEKYGPDADGFIEVHHTTPASEMGPRYRINPVTELVPVCSNCHSVVHLVKPPHDVKYVKALVDARRAVS